MQSAGKRVLAMRDLAPVDVAEGLRHMTRILRMNLGIEFEAFNPDFPLLVASSTETQKAGYDCPDYVRLWTYIRGSKEYRIRGVLGEAVAEEAVDRGRHDPEEVPQDVERPAHQPREP